MMPVTIGFRVGVLLCAVMILAACSPRSGNPTARALADQLPLTLAFRDLNGVEKVAQLPRPLTTDGVPEGADPDVADIGYYAPTQDLVLYYGDVGYWNGIVRIGRYDEGQSAQLGDQPDGFDVTFEHG
jgi:hypothetical protein